MQTIQGFCVLDKLELVHRYVGSFKSPKVNSLGSSSSGEMK